MTIKIITNTPEAWPVVDRASSPPQLVLAHGAGAPMDSPFMNQISEMISAHGWGVHRFEFPYMAERRETGKKRPPNRAPILEETWHTVIAQLGGPENLVIGGKSMGGRMASHIADQAAVRGLICLGYPFHPPGKPEKTRTEHLKTLSTKTLICQGSRDPFGTQDEVTAYPLSPAIQFKWLPDGNHDLAPRKKSGWTHEQNLKATVDTIDAFMKNL